MAIAEKEIRPGVEYKQRESISFPELGVEIPVYDIRNLFDHITIAQEIAKGRQMAMFGGVWGGFQGVRGREESGNGYLKWAKKDRPKEAKYAVMIPPAKSHEIIDWSLVHEDLRFLEDPDSFKSLWGTHGAYLHVIAPVRSDAQFPDVFVTSPDEYAKRYPDHPRISSSTAAFLWRADPYYERFADLVDRFSNSTTHIGVTSLNKHGEKPPYTFEEFVAHLRDGKADPREVHLVVRDSIYEKSEALGSHTQIKLPLVDEEGVVKILRVGTLSPQGLERRTGITTRQMPDAKDVRKVPGVDIDTHIRAMNQQIQERWESERQVVSGQII